jgi:Zn-dependent metalloprotease
MRRWNGVTVLVLVLVAIGCARTRGEEDGQETSEGFYADSAPPLKAQSIELQALAAQGAHIDEAAFHPGTHDLAFLSGSSLSVASSSLEQVAESFVADHPALFEHASVKTVMRSDDAEGSTLHASQFVGARRLLGSDLVFRFDSSGSLERIASHTMAPPTLPNALLSTDDALTRAVAEIAPLHPDAGALPLAQTTEPVALFDANSQAHGAYRIVLDAEMDLSAPSRVAVLIDDQTGAVLGTEEQLQRVQGRGTGVFGDRRDIEVSSDPSGDGGYAMIDGTRGGGVITYAWKADGLPGTIEHSSTLTRWDTGHTGKGAAVDAHANAEAVFDYFQDTFGREGIDGESGALISTAHFGKQCNDAFWDGSQVVYGDGDGQTFAPLSGGLDVVMHELAHGVTQAETRLGLSGQTGALNEAISDAFASLLLEQRHDANAWRIGATVYTPADPTDALRDLADPTRLGQPDHLGLYESAPEDVAHDNGAIHFNATIVGHALFLLSEGGTDHTSGLSVAGLGHARAEQVLYRALTHSLSSSADFVQMARATTTAASDLYGDRASAQARSAWEAVGILVPIKNDAGSSKPGDLEPNDTREQATSIQTGETITGTLAGQSDVDFYRLDLAGPAEIDVALTGLSADLDLELLNGSGQLLSRSETAGAGDEHVRGIAAAGSYFLKVYSAAGQTVQQAPYTLEVN